MLARNRLHSQCLPVGLGLQSGKRTNQARGTRRALKSRRGCRGRLAAYRPPAGTTPRNVRFIAHILAARGRPVLREDGRLHGPCAAACRREKAFAPRRLSRHAKPQSPHCPLSLHLVTQLSLRCQTTSQNTQKPPVIGLFRIVCCATNTDLTIRLVHTFSLFPRKRRQSTKLTRSTSEAGVAPVGWWGGIWWFAWLFCS